MRPNIDISHTLAGRIKDWAEANNVDELSEAYARVLAAGLDALEGQPEAEASGDDEPERADDDGEEADGEAVDDARVCPDCGEVFDSFDELREHIDANPDPDH